MENLINFQRKLIELQRCFVSSIDFYINEIEKDFSAVESFSMEDKDIGIINLYNKLHKFVGSSGSYGFKKHCEFAYATKLLCEKLIKGPYDEMILQEIKYKIALLKKLPRTIETLNETNNKFLAKVNTNVETVFYYEHNVNHDKLKNTLKKLSLNVIFFKDYTLLKQSIQKHKPTLIILDLVTVQEVLDLKSSLTDLNIDSKIMIISEDSSFHTRRNACRSEADYFEFYPVNEESFGKSISILLESIHEHHNKLLLIIDDLEQEDYYSLLLSKSGFEVKSLSVIEDIFKCLFEFNPHAIILEMNLSSYNGLELTRMIRQHKQYSTIPIIFLSASRSHDDITSALIAGADEYFTKPVEMDRMTKTVKEIINKNQKIQKLINEDGLTGLLNNRSIIFQLTQQVIDYQRYQNTFAIILIDLDNFKNVNDTYGHQVGDKVLKSFSSYVKGCIRSSDHFGRVGGEEFLIIMRNTSMKLAYIKIEEIREDFSKINQNNSEKPLTVTFSAGITEISDANADSNKLLKIADKCLYKAKNKGRNCIYFSKS